MRLHQIKKLLHIKGNNYKLTVYRIREKGRKLQNKGLIDRIYKELKNLKNKSINNSIKQQMFYALHSF
jgi:hypothetical protein